MRYLRLSVSLLLPLLLLTAASAAENLYPDPSFEGSGVVGNARTGEKAGYLKVGARDHWAGIGARVTVVPFARYRVTEWVKGRVGAGNFCAPYVYGWDSYEWAFVSQNLMKSADNWTQVSAEFVCPDDKIDVQPLAYIEAENCEAWVDDVVVEKIAEPEQVMAEVLARPAPNDNEKRLIVRWLVKKGDLAGATRVMESATDLIRADAATVIAKAVKDPLQRLPYLTQMVAYGGPTYNGGMDRYGEVSRDLTAQQQLDAALAALKLNPSNDRTGRAVGLVLSGTVVTGPLATVAEGSAQIEAQRKAVGGAVQLAPADSPAAKELQSAVAKLDAAAATLAARARDLGRCRLQIAGKTVTPDSYAIVVPDEPTPQEKYAARDLRLHLELVTGKLFTIETESARKGGAGFYLGNTRLAAKSGVRCKDLGLEGTYIKTAGPSVILAGNRRGVLYATYSFLEDDLGCRWFTPDCSTWPRRGTLTVGALNRRYLPPLEFRAGDYPVARAGDFCARLRLNGNNHGMSNEQGGRKGVHSLAHTFAALVPPDRYFATHPEYFSLVGGKRQSGYAQLCLTNPEVLKIAVAGVRQWIQQNPDMKVFSVSQNDCDNHCECENCSKVAEEEGSQSGPLLRFVNAVADDIAKDYPDVAIETLAYQYTRKPPKITKPRPNVIVCLCSIECCFIHPLETDEFNKTFADDIRGWNKICNRLWIWDYIINYAHSICPFPNLEVLKPNINFFIKSGVKGIYEESCYYTKGSELQELRNYLMAKALWDPQYDMDKATQEFCAAYYGAAAAPIREYLDLIHKSTQDAAKLHVQIYTHPKVYVFPDVITRSNALFDQAEAAVAGDPVLLHRVQVARLPILYAQITLSTSGAFVEKDGMLVQKEGQDVGSLVDRFGTIARAEGVTHLREGQGNLEAWLESVPRAPRGVKIEQIENPALRLSILPTMGGRLFRMTYLPANRELLRVGGTPEALSPADGGYEEYTEGAYRSAGWSEPYAITDRTPTSLTLAANLRNGLRVTRVYALDPAKALVTITTTAKNEGKQPLAASLRSHPEFAVTSTEKASLLFTGSNGKQQKISLANPASPEAEREQWLQSEDLASGQWTLVDEGAGLKITNTFSTEDVTKGLMNRNGAQARVNLELFGREVTLKPGDTATLRQSFEVSKQ